MVQLEKGCLVHLNVIYCATHMVVVVERAHGVCFTVLWLENVGKMFFRLDSRLILCICVRVSKHAGVLQLVRYLLLN